jgi:hypothetical protein
MTESEAFLAQAGHDLAAFSLLDGAFLQGRTQEGEALHFLQMATEKLGKAAFLANGKTESRGWSHDDHYFQKVWNVMQTSPLEEELGLTRQGLTQLLARCDSVRTRISELQPEVADSANLTHMRGRHDSRNVEYPWEEPPGAWHAPGDESFGLLAVGGPDSLAVVEFLMVVDALIKHFSSVFPCL